MVNLAVAVVCAAIGLVALPLTFTTTSLSASGWSRLVWLVTAALLAVVLLTLLPRLSRPLAAAIDRQAPSATPSQTRLVAQILVLGVLLVVIQAMVRRPVALVLAGDRGATTYESAIAATVLTVLLALLVWLYQSGRTLLQSVTLRAIDAAFPTLEPAPVSEPTRTVSVVSAPTLPADDATVRAQAVADDATVRAVSIAGDATVLSRRPDPEATIAADSDATLRVSEPGA